MPRVHISRKPEVSSRVLDRTQDNVILDMLEALDTPRSLAVAILYRENEHQQLVDLTIDPARYNDRLSFYDDYVATELLSKADFLKLDVNRAEVAIQKFLAAEEKCRVTNESLRKWRTTGYPPRVGAALMGMRWKIQQILGSFCPEEFVESSDWGPGATATLSRGRASRYNKFSSNPSVTLSCLRFISPWFATAYPSWAAAADLNTLSLGDKLLNAECVVGNKVTTVPKNAKTDRVICIEPALNLFFQKGVGKMIRRRLRPCNSIDRQDRNQWLSKVALSRDLATVDFSSASDLISYELVEEVLPSPWGQVMRLLRSASGTVGQVEHRWEKYSTMGNGYTFELETLLFLALAYHVCDVKGFDYSDVSVFGDDVILPSGALPLFTELSEALGFTLNRKKTHVHSQFRESCGSHWFGGKDVKPLYFKSRPRSVADLYKVCNGIRHLSSRYLVGFGCDRRFRKSWVSSLRGIPRSLQLFGPSHCGDSVIWENWDRVCPPRCRKHGSFTEGWSIRTLVDTQLHSRRSGVPLLPLRVVEVGRSDTALGNLVPMPGKTRSRIRLITVTTWHDPGEWI